MMEGFWVDLFQGYLFGRPSPTPAREPVESFSEGYVPEVQASMAGESGAVGWPIESRDAVGAGQLKAIMRRRTSVVPAERGQRAEAELAER